MSAEFRVAIADDNAQIRAALAAYLAENGIRVVAEAADGEQALQLLRSSDVDVVVLDVAMPSIDGLCVLRHLRDASPFVRVVVLTGCSVSRLPPDDAWDVADAFFLKEDCEPAELAEAIRKAAQRKKTMAAANDDAIST